MAATYQMRKRHEERPEMRDGIKRHKHVNPTDNEDDKTKGKGKEIKRLNNR